MKNRNWIVALIIFMSFNSYVCAKAVDQSNLIKTQTAVVNYIGKIYTVSKAKEEAFKDVKTYLSAIHYKADMVDKDYSANLSYMQKQLPTSGDGSRLLFPFYIGNTLISYGVRYHEKPDRVYYYNSKGNLLRIELDNNNPQIYPKRTITYNNKGNLHAVVLYISKQEQYNFDGQGNLVVHWIGERGYDRTGQPLKIKRSL